MKDPQLFGSSPGHGQLLTLTDTDDTLKHCIRLGHMNPPPPKETPSKAVRRLTPDFTYLYFSGGGMNCFSYDTCVYHFRFVSVFFPWSILQLQSDWSISCDHGLDYAS